MKNFIDKFDSFIRRLRWKAHFFEHEQRIDGKDPSEDTFGFKSERCPPQHEGLLPFETDLYEITRSITFKKAFNPFLLKLVTVAKNICTTSSLLIPADKTTKLYKILTQDYEKLLHDNITADYRKTSDNATKQINIEVKGLARNVL